MSSPAADSAMLDQLLIEVAHDLQNPISSILSACEYLSAYSEDPTAQMEMVAGIQASAATLLQLSGRILQLAGRAS